MLALTPGATLRFATSNRHKVEEARRLLGVMLEPVELSIDEIQAATLEEIVHAKLERARESVAGPLLVEDVSLGLGALGGFPGPYVRWLLESAGGAGLAAIARSLTDRSAIARCALACWDGRTVSLFVGETAGEILLEPRGSSGFGWDAWFLPRGASHTYAEMPGEEKDRISHRSRAFELLRRALGR
ncbi:MAG: non-canonical purine NTP pyrophosphatase [Thermoanaerobaculia bacterium]|jgi:non-canonical purine NTP pyrophosphatase (RdgB/HAM1 family)